MKLMYAMIPAAVILISGCEQTKSEPAGGSNAAKTTNDQKTEGGDHSGWWCAEHGIPEAECSMCNAKVAAEFKKKGDWCKKHNRAESQCFLCDPSRAERYEKLYVAKYGKKPPKREE